MQYEVKREVTVTNIKLELSSEEFSTLYMAMSITAASDILKSAKDTHTTVLNEVDQMKLFSKMQDVYRMT